MKPNAPKLVATPPWSFPPNPKKPECPTTIKCPKCGAHAFDLIWRSGLRFYKCTECGHRGPILP